MRPGHLAVVHDCKRPRNSGRLTSVVAIVTVDVETTVLTGKQLVEGVGVCEMILVTTEELLRAGQSVIVGAQDVTV